MDVDSSHAITPTLESVAAAAAAARAIRAAVEAIQRSTTNCPAELI
jgi:hypothetical protein